MKLTSSLKYQGALVCLVPLTVLLLELTWVQENLNNPTNTLSNGPTTKELTNLPSEEPNNPIARGLSKRLTAISDFDVGTSPMSNGWRKRFKFEKSSETQRNTNEERRNDMAKPAVNDYQS